MGVNLRAVAIVAATVLFLSGCSGAATPASGNPDTSATAATAGTETAIVAPSDSGEPDVPTGQYNALTGLYDIPADSPTRPVAIMIGNNEKSRPQYGIDRADMYVEGETEGGITRIMAVFSSVAHLPDRVGPVRSARSPFVTLVQALDAVYCHAGGSVTALARLKELDLATINALVYDGTTYWRDQALISAKGYEYSMMTDRDSVSTRLDGLGYRTQANNPAPFIFGGTRGTAAGRRVQIDVSGTQTISFVYDEDTHTYDKRNGTLANGEPHVCADGTPITVRNVVVLYAPKYMENELTCNFDLSSGEGIAVCDGTSRYLRYTCSASGLSLLEEDGTPLQLGEGKTYLCFVNTSLAGRTIVEG